MSSPLGKSSRQTPDIEPFEYPSGPDFGAVADLDANRNASAMSGAAAPSIWSPLTQPVTLLKYTEAELQDRLAAQARTARQEGARECETRLDAGYEEAIKQERSKLTEAIEQFGRERKTYFERVEVEVVHLALEVARKILHHEAQIDPLFLTGVVRVALERLESRSTVRLHVTEREADKWHEIVEALDGAGPKAEVVVDHKVAEGCCVLETEVGSTEISLDHQLAEVERGLLDLLSAPAVN
jgi:flagellar assembly protein FliH